MSVESILKENVETYEIPTTLDGLVHILDFNKWNLNDEQFNKLEGIVVELRKERKVDSNGWN